MFYKDSKFNRVEEKNAFYLSSSFLYRNKLILFIRTNVAKCPVDNSKFLKSELLNKSISSCLDCS